VQGNRGNLPISVLIADDHAIVRDGLRVLIQAREELRVVGEAENGVDAVRRVREMHPNVVIMDIAMPDLNGVEATRQIQRVSPATKVIILSMYGSREHISRALSAGASGYLLKRSAGPELIEAIRVVSGGGRYLSRETSETVLADYMELSRNAPEKGRLASLSEREREILQLLAEGKANKEIAARLHVSPKTVHTYRSRMMVKLGLHDTPGLIRFAIQHGLTPEA
jgi:DNA-binding NarL/FixJ family response regulator